MATLIKVFSGLSITSSLLKPRVNLSLVPCRGKRHLLVKPRKRRPSWLPKPDKVFYNESLSTANKSFVKEIIESKFGPVNPINSCTSPLKMAPIEPVTEWTPRSQRTGVIARKIGIYPMWLRTGQKVLTTLLHICDNHVVKYIPPESWEPKIRRKPFSGKNKLGCIIMGGDSVDPQTLTKEYCGLFANAGVMPKRLVCSFTVTPDAALQPGTPIFASHYKPGEVIDVKAKTMDRGFQGVCKRWGFKGMPASHGQTKTHRRPGNIGFGSGKARVLPGTKLPGHMGNRYRYFRGIQILRVNTKYNVIWVRGQAIPGGTNSLLQIYDSILPTRKFKNPPHFPTHFPDEEEYPEELYADEVHQFNAPTIQFEPEK